MSILNKISRQRHISHFGELDHCETVRVAAGNQRSGDHHFPCRILRMMVPATKELTHGKGLDRKIRQYDTAIYPSVAAYCPRSPLGAAQHDSKRVSLCPTVHCRHCNQSNRCLQRLVSTLNLYSSKKKFNRSVH